MKTYQITSRPRKPANAESSAGRRHGLWQGRHASRRRLATDAGGPAISHAQHASAARRSVGRLITGSDCSSDGRACVKTGDAAISATPLVQLQPFPAAGSRGMQRSRSQRDEGLPNRFAKRVESDRLSERTGGKRQVVQGVTAGRDRHLICGRCRGTGRVWFERCVCPWCHGDGFLEDWTDEEWEDAFNEWRKPVASGEARLSGNLHARPLLSVETLAEFGSDARAGIGEMPSGSSAPPAMDHQHASAARRSNLEGQVSRTDSPLPMCRKQPSLNSRRVAEQVLHGRVTNRPRESACVEGLGNAGSRYQARPAAGSRGMQRDRILRLWLVPWVVHGLGARVNRIDASTAIAPNAGGSVLTAQGVTAGRDRHPHVSTHAWRASKPGVSRSGESFPEPLAAERSSQAGTGSGVLPRHEANDGGAARPQSAQWGERPRTSHIQAARCRAAISLSVSQPQRPTGHRPGSAAGALSVFPHDNDLKKIQVPRSAMHARKKTPRSLWERTSEAFGHTG